MPAWHCLAHLTSISAGQGPNLSDKAKWKPTKPKPDVAKKQDASKDTEEAFLEDLDKASRQRADAADPKPRGLDQPS